MLLSRVLRLLVWFFRFFVVKNEFGLLRVEFIFLFVVSFFWIWDIMLVVVVRVLRLVWIVLVRVMLDMFFFFLEICKIRFCFGD